MVVFSGFNFVHRAKIVPKAFGIIFCLPGIAKKAILTSQGEVSTESSRRSRRGIIRYKTIFSNHNEQTSIKYGLKILAPLVNRVKKYLESICLYSLLGSGRCVKIEFLYIHYGICFNIQQYIKMSDLWNDSLDPEILKVPV